ncbi:MAG: hypothetical protein GYB53_24180 [Rhodobacteraceae bacterium]|nr:hypothetical protein [Paracoccaceae bacterium]MBR9822378.1 hypothetical protein [Paracoccaceae bacterium]
MHNYFELIGWFGVLHVLMLHRGDLTLATEVDQASFFRIFRENLLLMVSFHAEATTARTQLGQALLTFQNLIGVLMTFLVLARVIAMLPPPKSLDKHDP